MAETSTAKPKTINSSVTSLPTPVNVAKLEEYLVNYDACGRAQLVLGFSKGFDVGFRGYPSNNKDINNLKSTREHPDIVSAAISTELAEGRMAGPFSEPPFPNFQVSPIGLVPKKTPNSFRFIVDLSSPKGASINEGIDDVFAQVSYASLAEAIQLVILSGQGAFMAKTDIEKAFRLLPLKPEQYHLFCIKWANEYFHDRCLPMGARSSCQLFESFSSALQFIANQEGIGNVTHYLDDFLFVSSSHDSCQDYLQKFINICKDLNIPLAADKTFGPCQIIQFLGFEIDTIAQVVRLPLDKLEKCKTLIHEMLIQDKCTLRELQVLLGLLNFTCTVIVPGRAFLQRLYRLTVGVRKPYFSIRLTSQVKKDLHIWLQFLEEYNGVTLYREEMFLSENVCHIFSDASKTLGCGAVLDNHWFALGWPNEWWREQNITLLELVPIVLAIQAWGNELRNKCVILHTDNLDLSHDINSQSSKDPLVMSLIRHMVLKLLSFNILFRSRHIPGVSNILSDSLSRLQVTRFRQLHPTADREPTPVNLPILSEILGQQL